jgi:anti-sigma factor RsiW
MSAHLTQEELTDNLLGVSSLTVNAHLLSCPACANELDQLKNSISWFRGAAHAWSENALEAADRSGSTARTLPARTFPARSRPVATWVLATAVMILLVAASTIYLRDHQDGTQARSVQVSSPATIPSASQSQIDQDNELLSQVNSEIAEAVPAPMQPLRLSESVASADSASK